MPIIAKFYGLVIKMYFRQSELMTIWKTQIFSRLPPLK